jgi:hypothetical protein
MQVRLRKETKVGQRSTLVLTFAGSTVSNSCRNQLRAHL